METNYLSPKIELLEIEVEQGFATSYTSGDSSWEEWS